jgi:hypothetical protein
MSREDIKELNRIALKLVNEGNDGEQRIACALIEAILREGGTGARMTKVLLNAPNNIIHEYMDEVSNMDLGRMESPINESPKDKLFRLKITKYASTLHDFINVAVREDIGEFNTLRMNAISDPTPANEKLYKGKRNEIKTGLNLSDEALNVLEMVLEVNDACCFKDKE